MKDRKEYQRQYAKSLKGRLVRCYNHMSQRVRGVHKEYLAYKGLSLLSKEDFYEFSLSDRNYINLHSDWVSSNYDLKSCPSIDRIDSSKGYDLDNIRWLTHSENSRLGANSRWSSNN